MEIAGVGNLNKTIIENYRRKAAEENFEASVRNAVEKKDERKLREVCQDFEGILLSIIYREMKATILKSDLLPESGERRIFEEMLDQKLMEEASKGRGLGLADMLYNQLSKQLKLKNTVSEKISDLT